MLLSIDLEILLWVIVGVALFLVILARLEVNDIRHLDGFTERDVFRPEDWEKERGRV